jgi:alpha-glucosidase
MLLLSALRGSIILYQGEELGLPQVDVPFDRLQDPEAIANWPHTLSRDGARTPMPWSSADTNLGFSRTEPWLPVGPNHAALAVDLQERGSDSMLHFTRACLELRKRQPALRHGSMRIVEAGEMLLAFDRIGVRRRLRCTFNLSDRALPFEASGRELIRSGNVDAASLGPYAALIEEIP